MQTVGVVNDKVVLVDEDGNYRLLTKSERDHFVPIGEPLNTLGKVFRAKEGLRKLFFRGDMIYIENWEIRTVSYRQVDIGGNLDEVLDHTRLLPGIVCYGLESKGPVIFGATEYCRLMTEAERDIFAPTERVKFIQDAAKILCEGVDDNSLGEVFDRLVKK